MSMRLLLAMIGVGFGSVSLSATGPAQKEYRIIGIALSARDGAPIPYCRITANVVAPEYSGLGSVPQRGSGPAVGPNRNGGAPAPPTPGGLGSLPVAPPQAVADSSGRFSLEVPRAGGWRLTAAARGFRGQSYGDHDNYFSEVVLTESAPTYNLTFRLHPDSVLGGLVIDEAGEPVALAQVAIELVPAPTPEGLPAGSRARPVGFGRTDDRGRYEIGGLAPGTYRLRVQAQPWYAAPGMGIQFNRAALQTPPPDPSLDFAYPVTWFPGTDDEASAETIKLADGEERQADFHLTAIPSVHLRVPRTDPVSPPVPGEQRPRPQGRQATVMRIGGDASVGFQQIGMSGVSGNEWDFGGLTPGTYEVRIPAADGKTSDVRHIEVRSGSQTILTLDGSKPLVRVQVRLDGLPNTDSVNVEFIDTETGARISSTNPQRRGGFQRGDQGEDPPPEEAKNAGRSVMLPPHQFSVQVSGGSGAYLTGMAADGAKAVGRLVTISGPAALTLHLGDKHAGLDGIAHLNGVPAAEAMVLLVPATLGLAGDLMSIERDETNTDGSFRMPSVKPGQYILVAIDHGWDVDWRDPATLGHYLLHGKPVDLRSVAKIHEELEALTAK